MYGSPATSKDLNLPYPSAAPFNHYRKEESSDLHRHHHHQQQKQQQQQQQQMSSGLLRYRSAPSSLLGEVCEDFLPVRPSSPEADTMLARFLSSDLRDEIREKPLHPSNAGAGGGGQRNPQFAAHPAAAAEHGREEEQQSTPYAAAPPQMMFPSSVDGNNYHRVVSSMSMEAAAAAAEHLKGSNLIRHSSSPAGLFAHLNVENGYGVMRGMGGFGNGSVREGGAAAAAATSRLKGQISFSSRQGSIMSQISEIGSDNMGGSSPEESSMGSGNGSGGGRCYIPGYPVASWDDNPKLSDSFGGLKRGRDGDGKIIAGLNQSEHQNGEGRNHGLSHQFSLPKTSSELAAMEKFLQFQDAVPCKIRAKRGCATHPRSIAERVRRTRISERMRKLQELVPNMDKQTNTADMLDLAVEYIKDLQRQVKTINDSRANCTCSSKQKPY